MSGLSADRPGENWAAQPASAADVRNCYRLFLAREAEADTVVRDKVGMPRGEMLAAFVGSAEMAGKLGPIVERMPYEIEPAMLAPVPRELAGWIAGQLPLDPDLLRRLDEGAPRLEVIAAVLARDELTPHLKGLEERGDPSARDYVEAIGAALRGADRLRQSPLFDADFYRAMGADHDVADPALHYLLAGERLKLAPSEAFDPVSYRLNNLDLYTFRGNLLLHYEEYGRQERRPLASPSADYVAADQVSAIRDSALFDDAYYREQLGDEGASVVDAAHHYLAIGEKSGLRPSAGFDPGVYADLHADVSASDVNRLLHYELNGRQEGRAILSAADALDYPTDAIDPDRPTVLLLLHEATYTGAPILGWNILRKLRERYNVVVVLRLGGPLADALRSAATSAVGPLPRDTIHDVGQMSRLARRLVQAYRPLYAVANSVETQLMAIGLRRENVPIVALVHEFAVAHRPGSTSAFTSACAAMVFPAEIVRASTFHATREIGYQNTCILPQGPSEVPRFSGAAAAARRYEPVIVAEEASLPPLATLLAEGRRGEKPFTVIGLGTVEMRKGIDLFIAAGTALKARHPELPFRFIWIGSWDHVRGANVGALLEEQVARSGLGEQIRFFPPVDDLEPIYARADALYLSSRLDPLPNVTIDAALREIPILCFQDASGIAEMLLKDPDTANLVAPHLDSSGIAERIAVLATDRQAYARAAAGVGRIGRASFDMERYVARIDELGRQGAAKFALTPREEQIIETSGAFEPAIYFGTDNELRTHPRRTPVGVYLDQTRHLNFALPPVWGVGHRRPAPGFHPFSYGNEAPGFPKDGSRDAFAHYLERGSPPGNWAHGVIRLADAEDARGAGGAAPPGRPKVVAQVRAAVARLLDGRRPPRPTPRVAMHGHFHYTDNIGDFCAALAVNRTPMDLYLTTSSADSAEILREATRDYAAGTVTIETGRNIGRDVAPFLRVMRDHILVRYDVVGHVHGKRSLHTIDYDKDLGNRWRVFLWEHLIGPQYAAADIIIDRMAADRRIGLVFPENDFVVGWEKNLESGPALAARLGLKLPLPAHIDFPVGTMFWARAEALRKLVEFGFEDSDYPGEPLPIDGTMLHAIERLLPLICRDAGYTYETTYIPHVKR